MKVIILAGGLPSTLIEEDEKVPKPMAEIGGRPILWHIMKQYAYYGYNDFIICTGYKGNMIKDYFMNFYIYQSDITVDLQSNNIEIHRKQTEDWKVSVIDTGLNSGVTKRVRMVREYLGDEAFLVTYGDCVSDINIENLVKAHKEAKRAATFAVAHPTGRNSIIPINDKGQLIDEDQMEINSWVNATSMVFELEIFDYMQEDEMMLGEEMIKNLSNDNMAEIYRHTGFWSPMETIRDKTLLEAMWNEKRAPWKVWKD